MVLVTSTLNHEIEAPDGLVGIESQGRGHVPHPILGTSIGLSCPIVIKESFQNLLSKKYYLKSYLNKNYFISLYSSNFLESHSRFLCLASEKFKIERMFIFKNLIKQTIGGYFFNKISIPIK